MKKEKKNQYYRLVCWFLSKNIILFLVRILVVGIKKAIIVSGFEIVIEVIEKHLYPIIFF